MILLLAIACGHANAPDDTVVHGMTLSTPTYGREWGDDAMQGTLDTLKNDGVNWVSYHPYARIGRDGSVTADLDVSNPPAWMRRPIDEAHERGLKVLVKPHLAHWGSGFSWRGDIHFDDRESEDRFFREYTAWITAVATITADADGFVVGTELDGTLHRESSWRHIIASIRGVFPGSLTYASNWDQYERVPFWDALDAIGIQAYFPVLGESDPATTESVRAGWARILPPIHALSERTGKPVVFTELGYDAASHALVRPWEGGHGDDATQALALSTALAVIDDDPIVRGAFLWKWFPGEVRHGDFRMSRPEARAVIRAQWGHPL